MLRSKSSRGSSRPVRSKRARDAGSSGAQKRRAVFAEAAMMRHRSIVR